MSAFEKAMEDYYEHFGVDYPYAVGFGFPGKTSRENIKIIRKCIAENKPVEFSPKYLPERDY